jgi:diguanylate cyclase (GGDEF)-like protein
MSADQHYQVLLIEEEAKETELYADLIREVADCKVDVMSRVENSVDWIARSEYDLIVIDCSERENMTPGTHLNGLLLLEQIKRISPDTSVILISEQGTIEQAVAAIRMGAEDYLQKPFNLDLFKLGVKRGLDRNAVFGESSGASNFLMLLNSCQMISASLEQEKIFGIVQTYLARELKSDHSAIYALKNQQSVRLPQVLQEAHPDRAMEEILDIALHASDPLSRMAAAGESFRFVERGQLTPGLFVFRFSCVGKQDYFCVCLAPERPAAIEFFEARLRMLKAQIEVTGRNIEQYQGVQSLVYVDDATGLYNTRYLHNILDREISQAKVSQRSFAVLFIDADKFKGVNDTHGHLVGTKLLNELGNHLRKFVRETDTVFRYGGDEFVAVLSPCDLVTAKGVAERIRGSVEKECFLSKDGLDVRFTVTIGVAVFPDHAASKQEVIDAADRAMFGAKRQSRNSVMIAEATESKVEVSPTLMEGSR